MARRPSQTSNRSSVSSSTSSLRGASLSDPEQGEPVGNGSAHSPETVPELEWLDGDEQDIESSWHSERFDAFYEGQTSGNLRRRNSMTPVRRFLRRQAKSPAISPAAQPMRPAHWTRLGIVLGLLIFLLLCLLTLESLIFGHVPINIRYGFKWLINATRKRT